MWPRAKLIREADALHRLPAADPLVEPAGGRRRVDPELAAHGLGAELVLPQGQMGLALAAVAAHEPPLGVFPAGVTLNDALAQRRARGVAALAEVEVAESIERVETGQAEPLPSVNGPLLIGVIRHEVALVEGDRYLIRGHRGHELTDRLELPSRLDVALELVHVEPQPHIGIESVGTILEDDDLRVGDPS